MKNNILIGLLFLILLSGVLAFNKDNLVSLAGYQEECLEYKYEDNVYYQKECKHYTDYGATWSICPNGDENLGYLGIRHQRIVEKVKTNECLKWHLVKYKK